MYTIYTSPSTGGFAAEAMLEAGTASWTRQPVLTREGKHREPDYLAINPAAQVPALRLPGGQVMTESAAICLYLGDAHPETGLAPPPDSAARAPYLRWMLYLSSTIYPADLRYFYPDRHTDDPAGIEAVKSSGLKQMNASFALIDEALNGLPWLAGENMTAADIYLLMLTSWHPEPDYIARHCPGLHRVCGKVKEADFVQRANTFHMLW